MWRYLQDLFDMSKGVRRFIASESMLGISIGIFVLVFNLHLLEIGIDEANIGKITSVGTLVMGLLSIPSGLLANIVGRKKMLVSGIALMSVGYFITGMSKEYSSFYIAQIIASTGLTLLVTSEIQLLFHYSRTKKEEMKAFSMLFAIFTLFTGVGTLLGGFIPKWIGGTTTIYQWAIIISSIFALMVAIIRGIFLPKEDIKKAEKVENPFSIQNIRTQLSSKAIWVFSIFTFIIGSSYAIVVPFLNIILKFRFDWNDELVSLFLTANGFFLFLGSILGPYILDRFGVKRAYFINYMFNILLTSVLFFAIPVPIFAIFLLLRGGIFTMLNNMISSQIMQATKEEERNLFAGMQSVLRSFGSSLANYIAGIILAYKNYSLPFLLSGIFLFVGYIYFFILVRPILEKELDEGDYIQGVPIESTE